MSEAQNDAPHEATAPRRRSPLRRAGCAMLIVIWFAVLLTPCLFGLLLTRGEVTMSTGSAPNQTLRLWLISEASERGLGLSTASAYPADDSAVCVQTDVRYLLWAGSADPVSYCECYTRPDPDQPWEYTDAVQATCPVTSVPEETQP